MKKIMLLRCGSTLRSSWLLAALIVGALARAGEAPDPWDSLLEEALRQAAEDGRPIILYLPPSRPSEVPPAILDAAAVRKAAERFHLARARAADLEVSPERFRVKKVPALVLLDRGGAVVETWEGRLPADIWVKVDRAARNLKATEEDTVKLLADSRAAAELGDFAAALAGTRRISILGRSGSSEVAGAWELEKALVARGREEVIRTLSREGIVSDREVLAGLLRIRTLFPHVVIQRLVDREVSRIHARPLAGGRKP